MKKIKLTLLFIWAVISLSFAKPVNADLALKVGQNFLSTSVSPNPFAQGASLELIYTSKSNATSNTSKINLPNYFYVFNINQSQGFIIVSADDVVSPILGYSTQKAFISQNIPTSVSKWLEGYKSQIRFAIEKNMSATPEIINEWNQLSAGNSLNNLGKKAGVSPLCQTTWDQSPYYNALCPYDNSASERAVSGCVATAMAQVMKYWNYPASGTGYSSYNHSSYGTLSANFGSTTYNWSSMPNRVTSSNSAVATLMYQCGISVDMNYGIASTGGSGAYVISNQSPVTNCTEYALKTYFGYKTTLQGIERANYTQTQWLSALKAELDASRPIIYAGFGSGGGHCFVNDGYDNNNFLHFNWGWDGAYDGYFSVNALNPGGVGTGGGTGGFNSGHQAVIGIEPASGSSNPTYDMRLYTSISVNPDPIVYGSGFSATVNLGNYGTTSANNFTGSLTAAIFNSNNEFVSYIETKTGVSLNFNSYFTNPIVFTTTSISALTPGNYNIGIYYKPTGTSNWVAFANGSYQNFAQFTVQGNNSNTLKLYAAITTNPTVITQKETFTINFDILNTDVSTFDGEVSIDLHSSDGNWIKELYNKTDVSLPSNYHFTNGLTYTITDGINDSAGNYQLFAWGKPTGGEWKPLGSGNFSNPVTVQVKEPGLNPDSYEPNNAVNVAYSLPFTFSGNNAIIKTNGANCHIGTDYDYYKVILPSNNNYNIVARLEDSYSNDDGLLYTLDAMVLYSLDGTNWSDSYDDIIPSTIKANANTTIYFKVSPYFTGNTGNYALKLNIEKIAIVPPPVVTWFPLSPKSNDKITITLTNTTLGGKLHWGVNSWNQANSIYWPTGTSLFNGSGPAVQSPMSGPSSNKLTINIGPFNSSLQKVNVVDFDVYFDDNTWANNNSLDYHITITDNTNTNDITNNIVGISVYPNPSNGIVNINSQTAIQKIEVYNIIGELIFEKQFADIKNDFQFDMLAFSNGIYMVKVRADNKTFTEKIIFNK